MACNRGGEAQQRGWLVAHPTQAHEEFRRRQTENDRHEQERDDLSNQHAEHRDASEDRRSRDPWKTSLAPSLPPLESPPFGGRTSRSRTGRCVPVARLPGVVCEEIVFHVATSDRD